MALHQAPTPVHWSYFLALEDDLYNLARYVNFSPDNYKTYSIEIARLLMSACAEVDSVLKQLTLNIDPGNPAKAIGNYLIPVTSYGPRFLDFKVSIPRYGLDLNPWSSWSSSKPPEWWSAHNKVKHHRHTHFQEANLKNCLNAMAGLLVAVVHLHADEGKNGLLVGIPKLFSVPSEMGGGQSWGELGHSQLFYIDDVDNPYFRRMAPPGMLPLA